MKFILAACVCLVVGASGAAELRASAGGSTAYVTEAFLLNSNLERVLIYSYAQDRGFGDRILFDNSGLILGDAQYRFVRDVSYEMAEDRPGAGGAGRLGVRAVYDRLEFEIDGAQTRIEMAEAVCDTSDNAAPMLRTGIPEGRACASYLPEVTWSAEETATLWSRADSVYVHVGKAMSDSLRATYAEKEAETQDLQKVPPR